MAMIGFEKCYESSKVLVSMLLVQAFVTGLQLLSKVILNDGTFIFALLAYRHGVGAVCVTPLALYFERGDTTKLSLKAWIWLFINALTGARGKKKAFPILVSLLMSQSIIALGTIPIWSPGYNRNICYQLFEHDPDRHLVFSIILRIESLGLNARAGKVETVGAIFCVAGVLTTIFYQGISFHVNHQHTRSHAITKNVPPNWTRGTLMLVGSCLSYGIWFIVQYWSTMLTCIIASGQPTIVGLCIDRRRKSWGLEWNLQLIAIVYSCSGNCSDPGGNILLPVGKKELRTNSVPPVNGITAMDVEATANESTATLLPKAMMVMPK